MEKDDEAKGAGNSYTTEFRQYDPRFVRWLTLDPMMAKFPNVSPYVAFGNNPIYFSDPLGLEPGNENDPSCTEEPVEDPNAGFWKVEDENGNLTNEAENFELEELTFSVEKPGDYGPQKANQSVMTNANLATYQAQPDYDPSQPGRQQNPDGFRLHYGYNFYDAQQAPGYYKQELWRPNPSTGGALGWSYSSYFPYRAKSFTTSTIPNPLPGGSATTTSTTFPGNDDIGLMTPTAGGGVATMTGMSIMDANGVIITNVNARSNYMFTTIDPASGISYDIYTLTLNEGESILGIPASGTPFPADGNSFSDFGGLPSAGWVKFLTIPQ